MTRLGRIPGLDGLRAIAVLMVLGHHTQVPGLRGGFVGVDIFFVLSGYLITGILLEELRDTSSIDLKSFYRRRFCRLSPPLILLVATFWALGGGFAFGLWALVYLTDWMPIDLRNPLNHTWSLAIEEQFYLLWPLALLSLRRLPAGRLVGVLTGLCILATLWRIAVGQVAGADVAYFRFDTNLSGLLLGSVLSVALAEKPGILASVPAGRWAIAVGLALLALLPFLRWLAPVEQTIAISLAELATALTVLSIVQGEPSFRWLSSLPFVAVGRISYGVYLFHYPLSFFLIPPLPWWIAFPVTLSASLALAACSFHLVEKPIMRRFGARRSAVEKRQPVTTVVGAPALSSASRA